MKKNIVSITLTMLLSCLLAVSSYSNAKDAADTTDKYTAPKDATKVNNKSISMRPPVKERKFYNKTIEETILNVKKSIADEELAWMFANCFPNTLDTTVELYRKGGKTYTFVITGDIDAMWLRDSSAQVWPYLYLANKDKKIQELIKGLINQQVAFLLLDPYANAFNKEPIGGEWQSDLTKMRPELHERKWEIDSPCYVVRLSYHYWKKTGDTSIFDEEWIEAMKEVLKTFKEQQRKENKGPYSFMRVTARATDTPPGLGWGNPAKPNGLICSTFRPSDDATIFLYLVPSNYFAVVSLDQLTEIFNKVVGDKKFAKECKAMSKEVKQALNEYAINSHLNYGNVIAFEVDGYGNRLYMDDANVPSILSLPYLGAMEVDDPIYQSTRKFLLSENNPYYFQGETGIEGNGSPHTPYNYIWPMSIIMRAMTSTDEAEIEQCLKHLKQSHANTGFMHESFDKDNPHNFTRDWFAWANTLFGELILKLNNEKPHLLQKYY